MTVKTWTATVTNVHDGDTISVTIDLGATAHGGDKDYGFHIYRESNRLVMHADIRLLGCNAAELAAPGGVEARDHLLEVMPLGTVVRLSTESPDKYGGRYDATVTLPDGRDLVSLLAATGWAAAWNGVGTKPVPAWPNPATGAST